jgi:hypothetical protein
MALDPMDLIPKFAFWREGCKTMATNICEVLRRVGEPVTPKNIREFVCTLPFDGSYLRSEAWRKGYCSSCLAKLHQKMPPDAEDPLVDYFLDYFTSRGSVCQWMLIDAFIGILDGMTLEEGKNSTKTWFWRK